MADGMDESSIANVPEVAPVPFPIGEESRLAVVFPDEEVMVVDWTSGQVSKRTAAVAK